jgi:hypothetical protein
MKIFFSISFTILILLSGMHTSIARHICGGEIAAVKLSFTGITASCGMSESKSACENKNTIASNCCHNEVSVFSVDGNYCPSQDQIKIFTYNILQFFGVPVSSLYHSSIVSIFLFSNFNPPGVLLASAVSLDDICVFRI